MRSIKKLVLAVGVSLFSFLVLHSDSLAGTTLQAGAQVRLLSDLRNPVEGTLGIETRGLRLAGYLGNDTRCGGTVDLLARSRDGLYVGVGLMADRLQDSDFSSTSDSDTTTSNRPHDHGKHKGDHHKRHGKTSTTISSHTATLSIGSTDLELSPSLVLGVSGRNRGLFVESRVLFTSGDVSNRTSVGVRF